jgi:hypothetical protein
MQQLQLWIFLAIGAAFVVCGCILTRKPGKKLPTETLRPAVPDEHQPDCFALEEERGGSWNLFGSLCAGVISVSLIHINEVDEDPANLKSVSEVCASDHGALSDGRAKSTKADLICQLDRDG